MHTPTGSSVPHQPNPSLYLLFVQQSETKRHQKFEMIVSCILDCSPHVLCRKTASVYLMFIYDSRTHAHDLCAKLMFVLAQCVVCLALYPHCLTTGKGKPSNIAGIEGMIGTCNPVAVLTSPLLQAAVSCMLLLCLMLFHGDSLAFCTLMSFDICISLGD